MTEGLRLCRAPRRPPSAVPDTGCPDPSPAWGLGALTSTCPAALPEANSTGDLLPSALKSCGLRHEGMCLEAGVRSYSNSDSDGRFAPSHIPISLTSQPSSEASFETFYIKKTFTKEASSPIRLSHGFDSVKCHLLSGQL